MFEKNDKFAKLASKIVDIAAIVFAAIMVVMGIVLLVLAAIASNSAGIIQSIIMLIVGPFAVFVAWVLMRAVLSTMCDVKLIRNKLYGVESENDKLNPICDIAIKELAKAEQAAEKFTDKVTDNSEEK